MTKQLDLPSANNCNIIPEDLATSGARICQARLEKKMTIRQVADLSGMTPEGLSYIENGKKQPSLPRLRTLASILDVSIAYLGCFEDLPEDTVLQKMTKARLNLGLNKKEFAETIGISVKTLWDWENRGCLWDEHTF